MAAQTPSVTINESKGSGNGNGNGTKAFAGVIGLLLVIAGVYSMVEPMNQRINFLERALAAQKIAQTKELSEIKHDLSLYDAREIDNTAELSTMCEKFREVKTRFDNLDRRVVGIETWRIWWNREMLSNDSRQSEKISQLERSVYGKSSPP